MALPVNPGNWSATTSVTSPTTTGMIELFRTGASFPRFRILYDVVTTPSITFQVLNDGTGVIESSNSFGNSFQTIPTTIFYVDICGSTLAIYVNVPPQPSIAKVVNPDLGSITSITGVTSFASISNQLACRVQPVDQNCACNKGCSYFSGCCGGCDSDCYKYSCCKKTVYCCRKC